MRDAASAQRQTVNSPPSPLQQRCDVCRDCRGKKHREFEGDCQVGVLDARTGAEDDFENTRAQREKKDNGNDV